MGTFKKEEYQSARELCQTPLLLTFLCLIYQKKQSFPIDRSLLYQEALDILLEEWAEHNELQENRSIDKKLNVNLSIKIEKLLLSKIAYDNFLENKLFFSERDIVHQIESNLQVVLNTSQILDGRKVLKTIEIEQGILVERAKYKYSFSHLTLQEYLTAQYIYDNDLIEEVVKNHVTEMRWNEVFLLIAGLMRDKADKLLLAIEQEAHNYLTTPIGQKLVPILQWADEMTKDSPDSPIKPVGRRAISIAYAHAIPYTHAIAIAKLYTNANLSPYAISRAILYFNTNSILDFNSNEQFITLANLFTQDKIFPRINLTQLITNLEKFKKHISNTTSTEKEFQEFIDERQEFIDQVSKIWNTAFTLTPELLDLSIKEIQEINKHYFYINRLILDCQKVAVNISPTVWQAIEDRMLRVPPSIT